MLAALNTAALLPVLQLRFGAYSTSNRLTNAGELLVAMSMAAMGHEVSIVQSSKVGGRAMLVGTLAGLILLAPSLRVGCQQASLSICTSARRTGFPSRISWTRPVRITPKVGCRNSIFIPRPMNRILII